ncbi:MAG TPA: hypothetical protein VJQ54_00285 [Candidatus Sulfotelmatobacter sp.]|nr:hypothetical protein [Candidatus Sulfotelmatobacter sp.]
MRKVLPGFDVLTSKASRITTGAPSLTLAVRVGALCLAGMGLLSSGCGTTHAVLNFTAPRTVMAGSPFTVTVAVTINGHPDTVINSRIHFTSSDPAAVLPGDYYFTTADVGSHTWTNGFTLATPGNQIISGEIIDAIGINGRANVTVSP